MSTFILVAGVGNIFFGDDAFGVEVVRRLSGRRLPQGVRVADFGIRSYDLAYAFLDNYDLTILVDATQRGGKPGTLYAIQPDFNILDAPADRQIDAHGMNPLEVFRLVKAMGGQFRRVVVVGCEPGRLEAAEEGVMGLSEPVEAAVHEAVHMIEGMVGSFIEGRRESVLTARVEGAQT